MARYANDILSITGQTPLPNPTVGDNAETFRQWGHDLNAVLLSLSDEHTLNHNGDPNGNVASAYLGRRLFDTSANRTWVCTTIGTTSTAVWEDQAELIASQVGEELLADAIAYSVALG